MNFLVTISCLILVAGSVTTHATDWSANDSIKEEINRLRSDASSLIKQSTKTAYAEARTLLDSALSLAFSALGAQDTVVASIYRKLALPYYWDNQFYKADSLLILSREIWIKTGGDSRIQITDIDRIRSDCHMTTGRYAEALQIIQGAYQLITSCSDTSLYYNRIRCLIANSYALTLTNLARSDEAIILYREALDYSIRADTGDFAMPGIIRLHLAGDAMRQGDYDSARIHIDAASEHVRRILGSDNFYFGTCVFYSAELHNGQRSFPEARKDYETAIRIRANSFGYQSRYVSGAYTKLAGVVAKMGEVDSAIVLAELGLEIGLDNYAPGHPSLDHQQRYLAFYNAVAGHLETAVPLWATNQEQRRKFIGSVFSHTSEEQKLKYLKARPALISPLLTVAAENSLPLAVEEAFKMVVNGKAFLIDALAVERKVAICVEDTRTTSLLDSLSSICNLIASLTLSVSSDDISDHVTDTLNSYYRRKAEIEIGLSHVCSEFEVGQPPASVDIRTLANNLGDKTVLWDIVKYNPCSFQNYGSDKLLYGASHYLGFSLDANANLDVKDLGSVKQIDSLVIGLLDLMETAPARIYAGDGKVGQLELMSYSSQLFKLICSPILNANDKTENILISPDGLLNLLPFEILKTESDKFMIEEYQISYLSASRDLLEADLFSMPTLGPPVIISAVDYNTQAQTLPAQFAALEFSRDRLAGTTRGLSLTCLKEPFSDLIGTISEGNMVATYLEQSEGRPVICHSGEQATEAYLKSLDSPPSVLHIATHGFFCDEKRATKGNPLIYSGLALAGANIRLGQTEQPIFKGGDDGILTALEASNLNLQGTELVVLSTCKSGQGQVRSGEGVYGLRRAFQLAGAKSIIMSLFAVPDEATSELMGSYYKNWLAGKGKATSLRDAQLQILRDRRANNESTHPLFWGGFIIIGDPN